VIFFSTFGAADFVFNGRNPPSELAQRGAELCRVFMPSRPSSGMPAPASRGSAGNFQSRALQQPRLESPATSVVTDVDQVIGVSFGGEHRAYAVQVITLPPARVINDVIGNTGVVVMYNPIGDRARVLTGASRTERYVTNVHRSEDGNMEIEIDGRMYPFDGADWPLDELVAARMSWGEWKAAHPRSAVFGRFLVSFTAPHIEIEQVAGVRKPVHEPAESARLIDPTPVIGVTSGGQSRAYVCGAMCSPTSHVVNDLLGDTAVTVTYCDMTGQVRVFTEAGRREALDVSVHGLLEGKMGIKVHDDVFTQDDPQIPLSDLSFVRTTWGEWKSDHPFTDVFTGNWNVEPGLD
jgi:hypothetical protein